MTSFSITTIISAIIMVFIYLFISNRVIENAALQYKNSSQIRNNMFLLKKNRTIMKVISLILAITAILIYKELNVLVITAQIFILALIYGSITDITYHRCPDCVSAIILVTGFCAQYFSTSYISLSFIQTRMITMIITFAFLFIVTFLSKKNIGGADIKLISSLSFLFGPAIIVSLFLSLLLSVIGTIVFSKIEKVKRNKRKTEECKEETEECKEECKEETEECKEETKVRNKGIPMIPYLAIGHLIIYYVMAIKGLI